jgi:hypothetical protein
MFMQDLSIRSFHHSKGHNLDVYNFKPQISQQMHGFGSLVSNAGGGKHLVSSRGLIYLKKLAKLLLSDVAHILCKATTARVCILT